MKNYFAKLAARANVPVSSPLTAPKSSDPFEETAWATIPSPSPESNQNVSSTNEPHNLRSSPSPTPFQTEIVSPQTKSLEPDLPVERASEITLEPPSATVDNRPPVKDIELTEPTTTPKLAPAEVTPTHPAKRSLDETIDSKAAETSLANEQLAEIQREQTVLLRKADAFMEKLFERRDKSDYQETEAREERQELSKRQSKVEEPARLQPIPPAAREPEQVEERPSLVIGKLTVEVIPPTPAPVASPQQVIVVRGSRSSGTVFPSSRRFGLGQF